MIEANELRLGNLVMFDGQPDIIGGIGTKMCEGLKHSRWYYDRIAPIPITRDILVRAGFTIVGSDMRFAYAYKDNLTIYFDGTFMWGQKILDKKVGHFHTLQNIIFALTGVELVVGVG